MLVEVLVALCLFGIISASISEAHKSISKLIESASSREDREKQFMAEHFRDSSDSAVCTEEAIVPRVIKERCCELELAVGSNKKTKKACKLYRDSGFGLFEFLVTSLLVMLLASFSYPTLKQLIIERNYVRRAHLQKLSISELESDLERVLFDNEALGIPGITKILPQSDPITIQTKRLSNHKFTPHPNSSILLTSNIDIKNLLFASEEFNFNNSTIDFISCGSIPLKTKIVAGFFLHRWEILTVKKIVATTALDCKNGVSITLNRLYSPTNAPLLAVAPIIESDLYYLDRDETLRRYSLIQNKTTPIDYDYTNFIINQDGNTLNFFLTKKEGLEEREFNFRIEQASPNETSLLSLLL